MDVLLLPLIISAIIYAVVMFVSKQKSRKPVSFILFISGCLYAIWPFFLDFGGRGGENGAWALFLLWGIAAVCFVIGGIIRLFSKKI